MAKLFTPQEEIRDISELMMAIPLFGTIDLNQFISGQGDSIERISHIRSRVYGRNAFNVFHQGGWPSKDQQDKEILWRVIREIRNPQDSIEAYCPYCWKNSVYSPQWETWFWMDALRQNRDWDIRHPSFFSVLFKCAKCKSQELILNFQNNGEFLMKIGQYPSDRDLLTAEIKRYQGELHEEDARAFHTAITLHAFGIWAGSFVYLRRIFENLIWRTYEEHKDGIGLVEQDFLTLKMDEKINALSEFLPEFLVEHKKLYWILSKGMHELSDEECLDSFEVVKTGIELILDELIVQKRKKEKTLEFRRKAQAAM